MTDTTKYTYIFDSTTKSSNSIGVQETSAMILRCEGRERDLYFTTPSYNGRTTSVHVRWDKQPVEIQHWTQSTSRDAFFTQTPVQFMQKMLKYDTLSVSWQPYSKTRQFASFDLKDHHHQILAMISACS